MPGKRAAETVLDTEDAILWFYPRTRIVHHQVRRFVYGDGLRAVLDRGVLLLEERHATKWLSDDRANGPLRRADVDWCRNQWLPRARQSGWKHWAVIMPLKVAGQMNMRRWIELSAAGGLNVQAFAEPEPALGWLEAQ